MSCQGVPGLEIQEREKRTEDPPAGKKLIADG